MSAFLGKADIQLKLTMSAVPSMAALVCQRERSSVCSAPGIIINSSSGGGGDDDDANSGDEGNTRTRGNHGSSLVATSTGHSQCRPNVLAPRSQRCLPELVRSALQSLRSLLGRHIAQQPQQVT
jgi:hypothetical protein